MKKIVRSSSVAATFAAFTSAAVAHPGHSPTDIVAQVASPLSGADHALVFTVTGLLLGLLVWNGVRFMRNRQRLSSAKPRH